MTSSLHGMSGQPYTLVAFYALERTLIRFISSYHAQHRKHSGMNNMPVETAVLRRQSHPIISNVPIG
jgi:hypothetical protein